MVLGDATWNGVQQGCFRGMHLRVHHGPKAHTGNAGTGVAVAAICAAATCSAAQSLAYKNGLDRDMVNDMLSAHGPGKLRTDIRATPALHPVARSAWDTRP